jgi:hypothetical protein
VEIFTTFAFSMKKIIVGLIKTVGNQFMSNNDRKNFNIGKDWKLKNYCKIEQIAIDFFDTFVCNYNDSQLPLNNKKVVILKNLCLKNKCEYWCYQLKGLHQFFS